MSKQVLLATAVLLALGGLIYLWLQPRAPQAPGIIDLVALDMSGNVLRPLTPPPSIAQSEALDFHVQLEDQGYIYVFRAVNGHAVLESGPVPHAPPLKPGVWAPDWEDERVKGLRFTEGDAKLYVLATPKLLGEVYNWTEAELQEPRAKCPLCSSSSLSLTITPPVKLAKAADAGS